MTAQMEAIRKKLDEFMAQKDLPLRPTPHLKQTFTGFDGQERPLKIRYYQAQAIFHLLLLKRFVLGDDTGLGKCKTLDSLVLTDRGLLTLADLAPKGVDLEDDKSYPLDCPTQVWTGLRWAPIKRFYSGGAKPIKRITTRRGYETTGSWVHPIKIQTPAGNDEFIQMQNLKVGDFACIDRTGLPFPTEEPQLPIPDRSVYAPNAKVYDVPRRLTPDLAELLAYTVAEGWTNHHNAIAITQHRDQNPEIHDRIRLLCKVLLGWEKNQASKNRDTSILISSTFIREYLRGLGVYSCLSAAKDVPWPIFQSTRESVVWFLRAFFDSEGSAGQGIVEVSSASQLLLTQIQILLLRFGIVSSRSPKKVKGREHVYWRLTLCGDDARIFAREIGFRTKRKQKALLEMVSQKSNPNLDVVPNSQVLIEKFRTELGNAARRHGANANRKGSGIRQFGLYVEKTLNNIRNLGRNPTYQFLHKLIDVAQQAGIEQTDTCLQIQALCSRHLFYDPVKKIEDAFEFVADLEIDDPDHSFVADGFINHNTLEAISALCYIWEKEPERKVLVLTTKSATKQWAGEFSKFTRGVKVIIGKGTPAQRRQARDIFVASKGPTVMIMGYRAAVQDFSHLQHLRDCILVFDEATAFKNPKTQVHKVCQYLAGNANRTWGLTATLIKNNLMEGYGIYKVVVPDLFQMSLNQFMLYFCIVRMQKLPKSNRQIPVVVGYAPSKIKEFREAIKNYFIGRPKYEVASELPSLITQQVEVELTDDQETKYEEALAGLLEIGTGVNAEVKETTKLSAITYCQEIINDLGLLDIDSDTSPKMDALVDLLTEGDLENEKVIIFSRYRTMVDIIMPRLAKEGIKAVRITGAENEDDRNKAMLEFQNPNSDVRVVCITMAGSDSINLQAAKALICYDTPWSAGDFIQLVGRMIRIGSIHDQCYAIHLVARGPNVGKTVDHRVLEVLNKKMALIESVLGKRFKGESDQTVIEVQNDISDLFDALRHDAETRKAG